MAKPAKASPDKFMVRVLGPDGMVGGLGVFVGDRHIVTCAHAVNAALGYGRGRQSQPDRPVWVDFPLLRRNNGNGYEPILVAWRPPPDDGIAGDDIAGLELVAARPPTGAIAAQLAVETPRAGRSVRVFGYPHTPPRPHGAWARAAVRDVVGMVAMAPPGHAQERDSYAIGAQRLRLAWPEVLAGMASEHRLQPDRRFAPRELDDYIPEARRLPAGEPIRRPGDKPVARPPDAGINTPR